MRVVGYVRVSTDEQSATGVSLDVQEHKVRLYCELHGLELVELIRDPGESAKSLDRPGLARALSLLDSGAAEGIVVAKLDRLTRSVADLAVLLDRYFGEAPGKQLFSVADSIDTRTAAGRLVLNVLMSVAQWERETIVERTRAAFEHKRSKGERVGPTPFGFDVADDGRRLIPNATEQQTIGLILAWAGEHKPLRWIATELDRREIRPKLGGARWSHSAVAAILARERSRSGAA